MTLARRGAILAALAAITLAAGLWLFTARSLQPLRKPQLMLLTSLPLLFGEGFDPRASGSPAMSALAKSFKVVPIGTTSAAELGRGGLLLMAQPPAQSPENLVALNAWVRGGGRLLLLADPMLEWPSDYPLGNPLRPPVMFSDTGLLAHWGLRLDAPDDRGPAARKLAGREITTASPGNLHGGCKISPDALVAACHVGKGRAVVVADADLLNVQDGSPELAAVTDLLAWLSGNDSQRTDLSTGASARTT